MLLTACGEADRTDKKFSGETLKLFNWGEYMGEDLISNFEEQTGARVIVELFDSNEMLYTKLQAGDSYDVLVPSDYMIERLMSDGMLQPLNKSLIPNIDNLASLLRNLDYDPSNDFSVPYFWGNVGIVYNTQNVDKAELESKGFEILRDTRYAGKVYIYDSERDAFMIAFKALGYSMNTENEDEIQQAYEWLRTLNDTMDPAYVTDEVIDAMMGGAKDLAVVYSGDATVILDENPDMDYFVPAEGTNIWSDAMVIPANAENVPLAHEFINYVLTYDASYDNSLTVGYASSNKDVLEDMSGEGGLYENNAAYLPRTGYAMDEIFHDNTALRTRLSDLWLKVKAEK